MTNAAQEYGRTFPESQAPQNDKMMTRMQHSLDVIDRPNNRATLDWVHYHPSANSLSTLMLFRAAGLPSPNFVRICLQQMPNVHSPCRIGRSKLPPAANSGSMCRGL